MRILNDLWELISAKVSFGIALLAGTIHTHNKWDSISSGQLDWQEQTYVWCGLIFILLSVVKRVYGIFLDYRRSQREEEKHDKDMKD